MRFLFALAALVLLATFSPPGTYRRAPPPAVSLVRFEPVPLDAGDPDRRRLGRLTFLGGWRLTSNDPRFGGLSSLHVEGGEALAFSDSGWMIRFPLPAGRGEARGHIQALADGPGAATRKSLRDIESMAVDGDRVWLGFERRNAIWRYDRRSWRAEIGAAPPEMRRWPANRGAEAMVRFPDGRFLVLAKAMAMAARPCCSPAIPRWRARPRSRCATARPRAIARPTRPCCPTAGSSSSTGAGDCSRDCRRS